MGESWYADLEQVWRDEDEVESKVTQEELEDAAHQLAQGLLEQRDETFEAYVRKYFTHEEILNKALGRSE